VYLLLYRLYLLKKFNNNVTFVTMTAAVRQFAHFIIIHTEVRSLPENLFGKQKKNKNITVVTYDSVITHTLIVVTDTHRGARTPNAITLKSVGNPRHCCLSVIEGTIDGDFNAGVEQDLLVAVGKECCLLHCSIPKTKATVYFETSAAVTRKLHSKASTNLLFSVTVRCTEPSVGSANVRTQKACLLWRSYCTVWKKQHGLLQQTARNYEGLIN